jgi:hypothetical protein
MTMRKVKEAFTLIQYWIAHSFLISFCILPEQPSHEGTTPVFWVIVHGGMKSVIVSVLKQKTSSGQHEKRKEGLSVRSHGGLVEAGAVGP